MNNIAHQVLVFDEVKRQGATISAQVGTFPDIRYLDAWLKDGPDNTPCLLRVWYDGPHISVQIHRYHYGADIFTGYGASRK